MISYLLAKTDRRTLCGKSIKGPIVPTMVVLYAKAQHCRGVYATRGTWTTRLAVSVYEYPPYATVQQSLGEQLG